MKTQAAFLKIATTILIVLSLSSGTALAGNAIGATITNTNHPDPSAPRHKHNFRHTQERTDPNDPQCCGSIPTISTSTCKTCGFTLRDGMRLNSGGNFETFSERFYFR